MTHRRKVLLAASTAAVLVMPLCRPAAALSRREAGRSAVIYERVSGPEPIVTTVTRHGGVVIDIPAPGARRSKQPASSPGKLASSPADALARILQGKTKVNSHERLVEEYFRRLGVAVPAGLIEQSLFGILVAKGQEQPGDILFYGGADSRQPSRSAIAGAGDALIFYSDRLKRPSRASRLDPPWPGPHLFTRRVIGTVFQQYLGSPPPATASIGGNRQRPSNLPEHYETELAGIASFYGHGDGSHGRPTANGETFDEEAMTAAHRTLPFHTWVLVTNVENRRHCIVRINDRGPFAQKERVIDLSYRAARLLGIDGKGTGNVKLSVIRIASAEND